MSRSRSYFSLGFKLEAIKTVEVENNRDIWSVKPLTLDVFRYGSVLACMDTSGDVCSSYHHYRDSIIDGASGGDCRRWVLIVGYTSLYYRVRDSQGVNWGEDGYFRFHREGREGGGGGQRTI